MNWFYDNNGEYSTDSFVEIDRIYCLLCDSFTDEHWQILENIYSKLPGTSFQSIVPYWYGLETAPFHLSASVEPVGLQVAGTLARVDWLDWDTTFRWLVEEASLPRYNLD